MKRSLQLPLLCIVVPALLAGCVESRKPHEVSQGIETRNHTTQSEQLPALLAPLRFGMSASEAESAFSGHERVLVMVNSASLLEGGKGQLPSGVECQYALKDNLLVYVSTTDPKIRVCGIGAGSTLQDVRRVFPAAQLEHWLGFAWLAKVTKIAWMSFRFGGEPTATDEVQSVEFRAAARDLH